MEPFWALPALGQRAEACDRMNAPTANVTRPCFALKQSLQRVGTTSSGRDKRHQTFLCLYLLSRKRFGESILETCDLTALRWTCSQCTFFDRQALVKIPKPKRARVFQKPVAKKAVKKAPKVGWTNQEPQQNGGCSPCLLGVCIKRSTFFLK